MFKRHEVLFNQLQAYRDETLQLVGDVTEEMADRIPAGFRNNIRWNLGHIYLDQYLWIQHLTKETIQMPDGFQEWFGYGTSPADWQTNPPSLEALQELLKGQPGHIRDTYGERLEEEFPATEMGMHTIEQVLIRTIFHEGMHIEAIKAIRRFL
ncbi:DinB family protein [Brevibacillus migulae]|uniref:DinB family protein n=1 Tax=Brevibacillus migulae TaxID=1644114 RepID=UPI00106E1805|nr:DinB family protein [Brevibacillus migulae]